jgi:hypothetical protein
VPGIDSDTDPDDALSLGEKWLQSTVQVQHRIIVMNAVKMSGNSPRLSRLASRFPVYSPQSHYPPQGTKAVLAVYPTLKTLGWAEDLAINGALCVVSWTTDYTAWIARTGAVNLADPDAAVPELAPLPAPVAERLDGAIFFGGHNGFLGGHEKDRLVGDLIWISENHRVTPEAVEAYLLASGDVRAEGALRARKWYEGVLAGKRFRGTAAVTLHAAAEPHYAWIFEDQAGPATARGRSLESSYGTLPPAASSLPGLR